LEGPVKITWDKSSPPKNEETTELDTSRFTWKTSDNERDKLEKLQGAIKQLLKELQSKPK
jgi:hypothetical protein